MTEMSYLNVRVLSSNRAKRPNKGPERLSRRHCCNLYTSIRQIQYHLITHCSALFHVISLCVRVCSGLHKCLCARVHHPDCWQCWNRRKIQHLLYLHGFVSVWTSASCVPGIEPPLPPFICTIGFVCDSDTCKCRNLMNNCCHDQ